MTSPNSTTERLLNLKKIKQIKSEPPDQGEFERYLQQAQNKLRDASNQSLAAELIVVTHELQSAVLALGPVVRP
jgi:hypothetical protein